MKKILVLGSTNIDNVAGVDHLPVPGETILSDRFAVNFGGKGANQAYAAGKLGAQVAFLSAVGRDEQGGKALENLRTVHVDTRSVRILEGVPTGMAQITVGASGENCIVVVPGANAMLDEECVRQARAEIAQADILLMQLETRLEGVWQAAKEAAEAGKTVVLDPAPAAPIPDDVLSCITWLTPNESELSLLTGLAVRSAADAQRAAEALLARGVANVLVTLGEKGSLLVNATGVRRYPAFAVRAVDTTAAGDTFNAAFAAMLAKNAEDVDYAIRFASAAAAVSVTRAGAQRSAPTLQEALEMMKQEGGTMHIEPLIQCEYGKLADKVNLEPDFFTGFVPERRAEIVAEEAKFYHGITAPYSVDDRLHKRYEAFASFDGAEIPIKVYQPREEKKGRPAFVFFHGGGFKTCSVETHDFVPSYVAANADVVAFSVEYRLAPEYKYPIGLRDCYEALKWVRGQADRFGVDPEKLAVGGDSSGGSFAASLTLMARGDGFPIEKQVLIYPATDLSGIVPKKSAEVYTMVGSSDDDDGAPKETLLDTYLADPKQVRDELVTPLIAKDLSGLPKALLIQAECDALLDDGLMYGRRLRDAGVEVEARVYRGMPHAFILRTYEETFEALDAICAFLKA